MSEQTAGPAAAAKKKPDLSTADGALVALVRRLAAAMRDGAQLHGGAEEHVRVELRRIVDDCDELVAVNP